MSNTDEASLAYGLTQPDDVRAFWPEKRIETLRRMARDTREPDDVFLKSKRLAWMREFCQDAPSWLQTMAARERLRAKAEAALASCRTAGAQLQAVLLELDALGAPDDPQLDRWAEAVSAVPEKQVQAQMTPAKANAPMRQVHLSEAIAEADARAKDAPAGPARLPEPGQKLPSEQAWDMAHGKPTSGPSQINMKAELEKLRRLDPDFTRRVVGRAAAPATVQPPPPKSAQKLRVGRRGKTDEERTEARRRSVTLYNARVRARKDSPFLVAFEKELAHAREVAGVATANYRMALTTLRRLHGDELAQFVARDMLGEVANPTALALVVARLMGTFPNRVAAEQSCAQHYGAKAEAELAAGKDVLRRYAEGQTLEHEDGRWSWFRS